jgi:O-antigen ligase
MRYRDQTVDYEPVSPSGRVRSRYCEANGEEWSISRGGDSERPSKDVTSLREPKRISTQAAENSHYLVGAENWIRKRGHALSFVGLFLFTVVLYFRPYELIPALSAFNSMAFYVGLATLIVFLPTQLTVEGNLTAWPREVSLVLLLGLTALLSMPLAIAPEEAWSTFVDGTFLKALVMFVVMVNVVRTERRLKWLLLLALAVSVLLSVNAIDDYRHGILAMGKIENYNLRLKGSIRGLFENPNDLALHLVTMVPVAIALALGSRGIHRKIVYMAAAILMVAAIVVSYSRGGFLALVAIVLVIAWKLGRRNRSAAFLAVLLAAVLFIGLVPGAYKGRMSTVFDSAADVTGSSSQRNEILKKAVVVTLRYPLFGVGLGNFHYKSSHELGTHNAYIQAGAEMGLAAMVIYMMLIISPLRRLGQIERETLSTGRNRFYYLAVGLQASLAGYMVASFFAAVAYQWYLYYLVGYAIALERIYAMAKAGGSNSSATTGRNEPTPDSSGSPFPAAENGQALPS